MTMRRKLRDQIYENILSSLSVDDFILRFEKYISSGYHPDDAYEATENDWASIKGKRNYKSIQVFAKARYAWYYYRGKKCKTLRELSRTCGMTPQQFHDAVQYYWNRGLSKRAAFDRATADHKRTYGYAKYLSYNTYAEAIKNL